MARRYKRSPVWNHPRVTYSTMILQPDFYYMEEEVEEEEVRNNLCDASYDDWYQLYLNYYKRYRPDLPRVRFYSNGFSSSDNNTFFLVRESFFQDFREEKWYCRLASFEGIENYLEPAYYTNETQFNKSFQCFKSLQFSNFPECRFFRFVFHNRPQQGNIGI